MPLLGPFVRSDFLLPVSMPALGALRVLLEYGRRRAKTAAQAASKAEGRRQQWTARRERLWAKLVVASAFVFILLVTAEFAYTTRVEARLSEATNISFDKDGRAIISVKDLPEGELRRSTVDVRGLKVRFLLYRKPDGKAASVFYACAICGAVAFSKSGIGLVCNNWAAAVNTQSVG